MFHWTVLRGDKGTKATVVLCVHTANEMSRS